MGRWWGWEWSLLCQNAVFSLPRCLDSFGVSMSFIKKKRGKKKVRSLLTQAILQFCDSVILWFLFVWFCILNIIYFYMSFVKVVRNTLKRGSLVLEHKLMTISENLSVYISILYVGRKPTVCKFLCWFLFLVQTDLWTLCLFVVFMEECICCSTRIQWHCIQSVTAMVIVLTCFYPCVSTYFTKTALFPLYRWRNWSEKRLSDLSKISEWVRGRDWNCLGLIISCLPLYSLEHSLALKFLIPL